MTVRLPEDLERWVKKKAAEHPQGKTGVIREALQKARELEASTDVKTHVLQALE